MLINNECIKVRTEMNIYYEDIMLLSIAPHYNL